MSDLAWHLVAGTLPLPHDALKIICPWCHCQGRESWEECDRTKAPRVENIFFLKCANLLNSCFTKESCGKQTAVKHIWETLVK